MHPNAMSLSTGSCAGEHYFHVPVDQIVRWNYPRTCPCLGTFQKFGKMQVANKLPNTSTELSISGVLAEDIE